MMLSNSFSAVMVGFKVDSSDRNTYVQPDASIKIAVGLITNSFGERSLEEGTLTRRNQPKHSSNPIEFVNYKNRRHLL